MPYSNAYDEPKFLKDVDVDQIPSVDDEPTYSTVHCRGRFSKKNEGVRG